MKILIHVTHSFTLKCNTILTVQSNALLCFFFFLYYTHEYTRTQNFVLEFVLCQCHGLHLTAHFFSALGR